jgi:hypothetical protein
MSQGDTEAARARATALVHSTPGATVRTSIFTNAAAGLVLVASLLIVTSCNSSSQSSVTQPSGPKCQFQAQSEHVAFTPDGGSGAIRITTTRECSWSAKSDAPWVSLPTPATGQGEGSIQFTIAPNADPVARATAVTIEDQRLQFSQEARRCEFRLSSASESVDAAGGERTIQVTTGSPLCRWTPTADAPWIAIVSGGERSGAGSVTFDVEPLTGAQRSGTINIGGQIVRVEQGIGCSYTLGNAAFSIGSAGGTIDVPVSASPACPWTAATDSAWISIAAGASGSGAGVVSLRVAATDALTRSGTVTVAGRAVTITQSAGCAYRLDPVTYAAPQAGGTTSVTVTTAAGCTWNASSTPEWVAITAGQTGTGPGEVRLAFAANTGGSRTGTLRVADQTVTVTQGSGCTYAISPGSHTIAAPAANGTVQVTSADGCAWSATSGAPWVTIVGGASGAGNGQVQFAAAANTGPARAGSLTVAGHAVLVAQADGCTYSVTPPAQDVVAGGGGGSATVTTAAGCPWTAASSADWISLTARTGTGPGQVLFTAAANTAPARTGRLTIAGQPVSISQPSTCAWQFAPPSHVFDATGGNGNVIVVVSGACTWTAASDVDWITMTAGSSGTGNGLVQFVAAPSSGPARTGSITIAGQRYEVTELAR